MLLELAFHPNPFRWILPKGQSQNVWACIEPKQEVRDNVVLIGHLDSHRTPLLFAERWVRLLGNLVPVSMGACFLLLAAFIARIFLASPVLSYISIPLALVMLGLFVLMGQADFTPFTAGANDNATGVGVILETARKLRSEPLEHTRVWVLASGCEEVGCYGADAFAARHRAELDSPVWLSIDSVGGSGAGVAYLTDETFLLTTRSDSRLLEYAGELARMNPQLDAYPHSYKGAYTEGAIGGKHGFRVLSFVSYRRDGVLPEWHRPTDTIANIDPAVVENTLLFLQELLHRIDAGTFVPDRVVISVSFRYHEVNVVSSNSRSCDGHFPGWIESRRRGQRRSASRPAPGRCPDHRRQATMTSVISAASTSSARERLQRRWPGRSKRFSEII